MPPRLQRVVILLTDTHTTIIEYTIRQHLQRVQVIDAPYSTLSLRDYFSAQKRYSITLIIPTDWVIQRTVHFPTRLRAPALHALIRKKCADWFKNTAMQYDYVKKEACSVSLFLLPNTYHDLLMTWLSPLTIPSQKIIMNEFNATLCATDPTAYAPLIKKLCHKKSRFIQFNKKLNTNKITGLLMMGIVFFIACALMKTLAQKSEFRQLQTTHPTSSMTPSPAEQQWQLWQSKTSLLKTIFHTVIKHTPPNIQLTALSLPPLHIEGAANTLMQAQDYLQQLQTALPTHALFLKNVQLHATLSFTIEEPS